MTWYPWDPGDGFLPNCGAVPTALWPAETTHPIAAPTRVPLRIPGTIRDMLSILAQERTFGVKAASIPLLERAADARLKAEFARVAEVFLEVDFETGGVLPCSDVFRIVRDAEQPRWSSPLLAVCPEDFVLLNGRLLFEELRAVLRTHVHFPEEWEYDLAALYVIQCGVADLLPGFFYALIDGTKGAGKTTFLDHSSRLTGSLRLQSFTLATLSRSMVKFRPVSIDEFDITEKNPEIGSATAALVRQGYNRDAAPRLICAPRSNEVLPLEIAGPKAITFRYDLDDALKDRGFRFPMAAGSEYRLVVLGMAPEFGDLPDRLKAWAVEVHQYWTFERVCVRIKEPSFEVAVRAALGGLSATRGAELMTTALVVSEIVGVDIAAPLRDASGARDREGSASRGVEKLMDALRLVAAREGPGLSKPDFVVVPQTAVRMEVDRVRQSLRLLPLKDGEFARLRKDALIQDAWRVKIHGNAHWKVPRAFLAGAPGSDTPDTPESPSPQDDRVSRVAQVIPPGNPPPETVANEDGSPEDGWGHRTTKADRFRAKFEGQQP
jgi:hypothetical protein